METRKPAPDETADAMARKEISRAERRELILGNSFARQISIRAGDGGDAIDLDARTVRLAISSEEPYQRWEGVEILDHNKGSIRLDRLRDGAPLLDQHDPEKQIGVVLADTVEVGSDRVLRATAKISRSARGDEILMDLIDGIKTKVSVGYMVYAIEWVKNEDGKEGDQYRVTDWQPFEASLVSIPADNSVGVGRKFSHDARAIESNENQKRAKHEPGQQPPQHEGVPSMSEQTRGASGAPNNTADVVDIQVARNEAAESETARVREISATCRKWPQVADLEQKAIRDGWTAERLHLAVLDRIEADQPTKTPPSNLDLGENEQRQYSLLRAIRYLADGKRGDGFEIECSNEIAKRLGKDPNGIYIPDDVRVNRKQAELARRTLTAGTATGAAELVGDDLLAAEFVDVLRNAMMVRAMGARYISGLRGDISLPKKTSGASVTWKSSEAADAANSEMATTEVSFAPKTAAAYSDITRDLAMQSTPDAEALVRDDLAQAMAVGIDSAAINGSGSSGQPTGILSTSGIGDVAGGTNGAAPTWSHLTQIWAEVSQDNALMGNLGWLINAKTAAKLARTDKGTDTGQFCLDLDKIAPDGFTRLLGLRCGVTNQAPSNLTKGAASGVCSAIILANFADLIIAEWGGTDLTVDPFTLSLKGSIRLVVHKSIDVGVRHAQSFAAMQDALTT